MSQQFWVERDENTRLWHWCVHLPDGRKWVSGNSYPTRESAVGSAEYFRKHVNRLPCGYVLPK